ncbi:Cdc20/Fizzy family WD repeat protein [Schizosaccharomyces cryophilus OY26]|uniref:Cdc20/Fizzy family WD repeat protein n=1 Tax=Schizosaccharomyces cryophilus (strain OY26 / ATCC MYA-4695 / CBS 11777 / NBRC 106824 / NRRL Y48691) TaxID=653667 RepID=S9VZM8_SCHCR|nr:Cdc20/Fizzy family WD repeat protein [Schizosaccharomyces cryophilus OY26]EPY51280.1 Cdc20/Fizzy family WD repeat protein [Schizosaccharomyces cryophilus OY26]
MELKKKQALKSPGRLWRITKIRRNTTLNKTRVKKRKESDIKPSNKTNFSIRKCLDRFIPSNANAEAFRILDNSQHWRKHKHKEDVLPKMLNLNLSGVLNYKILDKRENRTSKGLIDFSERQLQGSRTNQGPLNQFQFQEQHIHSSTQPYQGAIHEYPVRILEAPGLLDDFYISPLAWSSHGELAVALRQHVYVWDELYGTTILEMRHTDYVVSSLAYSADGAYLAIARVNGSVEIWDRQYLTETPEYCFQHEGDISCMAWSPTNSTLLVGGSMGSIYIYHKTKSMMCRLYTIKHIHQEQVCGLEWNYDGTQFASGGNDNLVCVFDMNALDTPKHFWSHSAAVKALAFCPWQKSLLAIGTGSNDQHIYFYDTFRGNLISRLFCGAQITSINWSRRYKEFCFSLGYAYEGNIASVIVCRWPQLTQVFQVPFCSAEDFHQDLRTIMAIHTHRKRSKNDWEEGEFIVVANNDQTVKFYKIWGTESPAIHNDQVLFQEGIFGSHILEMLEGVPENILLKSLR